MFSVSSNNLNGWLYVVSVWLCNASRGLCVSSGWAAIKSRSISIISVLTSGRFAG